MTFQSEIRKCYTNVCRDCCYKCNKAGDYISCYIQCHANQDYFDEPPSKSYNIQLPPLFIVPRFEHKFEYKFAINFES